MRGRRAGGFLAAVAAGLVVAAAPSPAWADGRAFVDGNDVAGPLDIGAPPRGTRASGR